MFIVQVRGRKRCKVADAEAEVAHAEAEVAHAEAEVAYVKEEVGHAADAADAAHTAMVTTKPKLTSRRSGCGIAEHLQARLSMHLPPPRFMCDACGEAFTSQVHGRRTSKRASKRTSVQECSACSISFVES
jgi:hypothetical protein